MELDPSQYGEADRRSVNPPVEELQSLLSLLRPSPGVFG
jgi:hypothetical protein